MIKIQVLGKGMIPRGYGLAPRTEPFFADLTFINTIMNTPGLTVRYLNPTTMQFGDLDRKNVKKIYDKYSNVEYGSAPKNVQQPHIPDARKVVQQGPANVNGMTVPPAAVPSMTEVIHTDPPQYKPVSFAEMNKAMKDFASATPAEEVKNDTTPDHTNVEDKPAVEAAPVEEVKKEEPVAVDNDTIKPVNAPDKNQQHNKNGKK